MIKILSFVFWKTGHFLLDRPLCCSPYTADMRRWILRVPEPSATKKQTPPLCSSLLAFISMLDEHTLHYAHLQSNKETNVLTCAFSLCISPTLQMAVSIGNNSVASFYVECVLWRVLGFHLAAPHNYMNY